MASINGIPCFKATIDTDDTGMFVCSFVAAPAIEEGFLAFAKQEQIKLSIQSEEERMVLGAVMVPDKPLYRQTDDGAEYYIVYDSNTIHKMVERFFQQSHQNDVDIEHSFKLEEGVYLVQSFFKSTAKGINPVGFESLPDDTLFFQYHVTNDELWAKIKEGEVTGFSLAGMFNIVPMEEQMSKVSDLDECIGLMNRIVDKINKKKN